MRQSPARVSGMNRGPWIGIIALVAAFGLSGCMSSPTYGTGKTAGRQLMEDVTGILSLGPTKSEPIDYKPRPGLVTPADASELPSPQQNVVTAGTAAWPESPEMRRARLRADATERRDDPGYRPAIRSSGTSVALSDPMSREAQRQGVTTDAAKSRKEFNRRLAASQQGDPDVRRYLSEPPLEYRAPAETAPADDVGVDEHKKERQRKAAARKKEKSSWRDLVPWL